MPLDPALAERIAASVAEGFPEQVAFTQDWCASPRCAARSTRSRTTCSEPGASAATPWTASPWTRRPSGAIPAARPISDEHSEAPIVVAIHRPREETGRSLILQAHVDVVPTGPADLWTHPPFEPRDRGRLAVWPRRRRHEGRPCRQPLRPRRAAPHRPAAGGDGLPCSPWSRRNSTGNGALMTHLRGYRADAVLIPEPEDEKLVRANTGVLWFQVEVRGHPGACARDGRRRQRHRRRLPGDRGAAGARGRVERATARATAFRGPRTTRSTSTSAGSRAATGPPRSRPGAGSTAASRSIRASARGRGGARDRGGGGGLRPRATRFLANNPPAWSSTASSPRATCWSRARRQRRSRRRAHRAATGRDLQSFMTRRLSRYPRPRPLRPGARPLLRPDRPEHPRLRRTGEPAPRSSGSRPPWRCSSPSGAAWRRQDARWTPITRPEAGRLPAGPDTSAWSEVPVLRRHACRL